MSNDEGLSVNERQAAEAQAAANRRAAQEQPLVQPDAPGNLAARALELANEQGEPPAETVQRATEYLKFLKENQDG